MWREGCGLRILMMLGIETKKNSRRSIPTKLFAPTILMVSNPQRRCQTWASGSDERRTYQTKGMNRIDLVGAKILYSYEGRTMRLTCSELPQIELTTK